MEATAKLEAESIIRNLPDDTSYEDIHYHLYVAEKIGNSLKKLDMGQGVSNEEAKKSLAKWISN